MNTIKKMVRRFINMLQPTESIPDSKQKWNKLAKENAAYYVMTNYGEGINEKQFRSSGEKDYKELIENDLFIRSTLDPFVKKDVLEIGCGIGRITEFFGKNFHSVSGVDISEEMVGQAKKRLASFQNVILKATDGLHFPFMNNSFDFIFSFIVFQHMPDKKTVRQNLNEIARVLKIGGLVKIQLRGLPTSKRHWFYGPFFELKDVESMVRSLPLSIIKTEGEGQRYFWIWLKKN